MGQMVCTQVLHTAGNRSTFVGEFFDSKDKIVKNAKGSGVFVTLEEWAAEHGGPPVEQATAAPGETRTVKKPRKKKPPVEVEVDADEDG